MTDFDVAPLYGQGRMERFLGEGIAQLSAADAARARVFTKVGRVLVGEGDTIAVDNDYTYAGAERSLRGSVDRLGPAARIHGLKIHDERFAGRGSVDEVAISLGNDNEEGIADALVHMRDVEGTIASVVSDEHNVEKWTGGRVGLPSRRTGCLSGDAQRQAIDYDEACWLDGLCLKAAGVLLACQGGIEPPPRGLCRSSSEDAILFRRPPRSWWARDSGSLAQARDDLPLSLGCVLPSAWKVVWLRDGEEVVKNVCTQARTGGLVDTAKDRGLPRRTCFRFYNKKDL